MQLAKLCLLGAVLLLAAASANALYPSPGETPSFPNLKAGAAVTTNITTYSTSSQYVTVRPPSAVPSRLLRGKRQLLCKSPSRPKPSVPNLTASAATSTNVTKFLAYSQSVTNAHPW